MHEDSVPAIDVAGLTKTYPGDVHAVRGISFAVPAGEVFGLLGPNGAGKSTTVGMLTTTIVPSSGRARLSGHDVVAAPREARGVSSVVFQEPVVDRALSGRRHLEIHADLWNVDRGVASRRTAELAATLDISELLDRPVSTYSGGQRRRLEIARALVSAPHVLFLDEPTVGLDPRIRAELVDVLIQLRERSATTILLTTHYLDEAEHLCDRVAVMHDGHIVALDTPRRLRAGLGAQIVELRADADPAGTLAALRREGLAGEDAFAVGATITLPLRDRGAAETIGDIERAGIRTSSIGSREPTLDDVYLQLTGGRLQAA